MERELCENSVLNSGPTVNRNEENEQSAPKASSGPKTPQGKRRSSRNATKHGFFSQQVADLLTFDKKDRKAYLKLLAQLRERWNPADVVESIQIELMATHLHNFKRALREAAATRESAVDDPLLQVLSQPPNGLEAVQRWAAYCEKSYYRAMFVLEQVRGATLSQNALPRTT